MAILPQGGGVGEKLNDDGQNPHPSGKLTDRNTKHVAIQTKNSERESPLALGDV